jgi:hypothetical protein
MAKKKAKKKTKKKAENDVPGQRRIEISAELYVLESHPCPTPWINKIKISGLDKDAEFSSDLMEIVGKCYWRTNGLDLRRSLFSSVLNKNWESKCEKWEAKYKDLEHKFLVLSKRLAELEDTRMGKEQE